MKGSISDKPVFVSVIIPVFNDSKRLIMCLEALQQQEMQKLALEYEVIVVDNNSTEDIKKVCNQHQAVYVHETKKGSYAARNKGIGIAKGDYLAFTDSDCIPDPYWLEEGVSALLEHSEAGMVGGNIQLFYHNAKPSLGDTYDLAFAFPQQTYIHKNHFAATANMFTTKQIFKRVGLFNKDMASGGDYEWGQRVYAAEIKQIFVPKAIVKHPTRSSMNAIIRKSYRVNNNFNSKYHQAKASFKHLIKYIYELIGIHVPITQASKKLRTARTYSSLNLLQKTRLFLLLVFIHYVKTFSRLKEWFRLKFSS